MSLFDILACPICQVGVTRHADHLDCPTCARRFPIVHGVPIMFPDGSLPAIQHESELETRDSYNPWVHRLILQSLLDNQVVLEIGSGNMALDDPCIIRTDVTLSPYVDVVADAHMLPFLPSSLDYVFSLAVVEHLRNPFQAADSIFRVLKEGGFIYHECNFVFAYHGYPHHYFNASQQGMEQIFAQFTPLRTGVATYQMPSFALDMVLRTYLHHTHAHAYAHGRRLTGLLHQVLDQNLMQYDIYFDEPGALNVAAGTFLAGVKQAQPGGSLVPAVVQAVWRREPALQQRFPNLNNLCVADNILLWAQREGCQQYPEIAAYLEQLVPFNKREAGSAWDRRSIRCLPVVEAPFGAIGFDPHLTMAQNAAIAEARYPVETTRWRLWLKRNLIIARHVLRHEGLGTFISKTLAYFRQVFGRG